MEKLKGYGCQNEKVLPWQIMVTNLYLCPVCSNFTLEENIYEDKEKKDGPTETNIVFPQVFSNHDYMPQSVQSAYNAALKVRHIDGAICAIAIRRTLEKMCKDKGEVEGSLQQKLNNLSEKGTIPPVLDEIAFVLKQLGNLAAHADEMQFSDEIVNLMIEFTKAILDYVYNLPQQLNNIQSQIKDVRK